MRTLLRLSVSLAAAAAITVVPASAASAAGPQGLSGAYFDDPQLGGAPHATRVDAAIDFDWALTEPLAGLGETFGVRWTGTVTPRYGERYTFITRADDGVRLRVDGRLVIDDWTQHGVVERSGEIELAAGRAYEIELEYNDVWRRAVVQLLWRSASQAREVIPASRLRPPVVAEEPAGDAPTVPAVPGAPASPAAPAAGLPAPLARLEPEVASVLPPPELPVVGETFNVAPLAGEVLVRRPEDGALIPLGAAASLPVGSRVDAREGTVWVQTAPAKGVELPAQFAELRGAMFKVGQRRKGSKVVDLDLQHGDFESCAPAAPYRKRTTARAAGRSKSTKRVRSVWASGKGRFRTRGRHAAATVRGTVWQVEDRCDATVTRVREGVVDVEDFGTGRTVTLRAGQSYVARPRKAR